MTFNLEWANDPESGGITASYGANVMYANRDGAIEMGVVTHHEGPGFYNANNARWWWLVEVMAELRMATDAPSGNGIPLQKLSFNDGACVHPEEILGALANLFINRSKLTALLADEDDPEECRRMWDEWLEWLRIAAAHGGFRVN